MAVQAQDALDHRWLEPAWLGNFFEFIQELRDAGFSIGFTEELNARALLLRLAGCRIAITTPEEAVLWLAPVLCSNLREQQLFAARLNARALRYGWRPEGMPPGQPPADDSTSHTDRPPAWTTRHRRVIIAIAALLIVTLAAVVIIDVVVRSRGIAHAAPVPAAAHRTGLPNFHILDALRASWDRLRLALLPYVGYVVWRRRQQQRRSSLERKVGLREPNRREVYLTEQEPYLFTGLSLHRPLQALRAHRQVPSSQLDVAATVRATIASAGRVRLRYGHRPQLPHYLLLIDRLSTHDHLAKLGEFIANRLRTEQIHFVEMTFSGDPRTARGPDGRTQSLQDLAAYHGEFPLLIVGDGEGLFDPLRGEVHAHVHDLFRFSTVVLLTPLPLRRWSHRERALAACGIVVLPATIDGIIALGNFASSGAAAPLMALQRTPAEMSLIGREGTQRLDWLLDTEPAEREQILDALFRDVPLEALELLSAMAFFPQVRLDVTLHLGLGLRRADGSPLLDEAGLGAIARLPWLRLGRMPDWLRLALIDLLPGSRDAAVRGELRKLLVTTAGDQQSGRVMTVATDKLGAEGLWQWLRDTSRTTGGAALHDAIFLTFMRGERPDRLVVEAPDSLRRLLAPRKPVKEFAGLGAAAVAALLVYLISPELPAALSRPTFANGYLLLMLVSLLAAPVIWQARAMAPSASRWQRLTPDPVWLSSAALACFLVSCGSSPPIPEMQWGLVVLVALFFLVHASQVSPQAEPRIVLQPAMLLQPQWVIPALASLSLLLIASEGVRIVGTSNPAIPVALALASLPLSATLAFALGGILALPWRSRVGLLVAWPLGQLLGYLATPVPAMLLDPSLQSVEGDLAALTAVLGGAYCTLIALWKMGVASMQLVVRVVLVGAVIIVGNLFHVLSSIDAWALFSAMVIGGGLLSVRPKGWRDSYSQLTLVLLVFGVVGLETLLRATNAFGNKVPDATAAGHGIPPALWSVTHMAVGRFGPAIILFVGWIAFEYARIKAARSIDDVNRQPAGNGAQPANPGGTGTQAGSASLSAGGRAKAGAMDGAMAVWAPLLLGLAFVGFPLASTYERSISNTQHFVYKLWVALGAALIAAGVTVSVRRSIEGKTIERWRERNSVLRLASYLIVSIAFLIVYFVDPVHWAKQSQTPRAASPASTPAASPASSPAANKSLQPSFDVPPPGEVATNESLAADAADAVPSPDRRPITHVDPQKTVEATQRAIDGNIDKFDKILRGSGPTSTPTPAEKKKAGTDANASRVNSIPTQKIPPMRRLPDSDQTAPQN